jgi:hypothetical protein
MLRQELEFNKVAFNNTFMIVELLQDQSQRVFKLRWAKSTVFRLQAAEALKIGRFSLNTAERIACSRSTACSNGLNRCRPAETIRQYGVCARTIPFIAGWGRQV